MKKLFIGFTVIMGLAVAAAFAADWSNPNPRSGGDSAGQLLLKHEDNMTDLYGATGKLNVLKESFAGTTAPTAPETGQPWYDTTNDWFQIYDASGWGYGGFYSAVTSSLYNIYTGGTLTATNAVLSSVTATSLSTSGTLTVATLVTTGSGSIPNLYTTGTFTATTATVTGTATVGTLSTAGAAITGGTVTGITDLAVADGGTGASTAADARTNLGLGTIATQAADSVSITGGAISGITDLAVADGGTGASTAADARTNLGLGTISTQAADSVSITGGSIAGITDLAIADGGTGQSTATAAFDALAPSTTKGDLIVHNGTDNVRVPVGGNGTVLMADSSVASGLTYTSVSALPAGNADTVDTFHASQTPGVNTIPVLSASGGLNIPLSSAVIGSSASSSIGVEVGSTTVASTPFIDLHSSGTSTVDYDARIIASGGGTAGGGTLNFIASSLKTNTTNTIWHAGNDGTGSGADSDTVDGYHASQTPGGNAIPVTKSSGAPLFTITSVNDALTLQHSGGDADSKKWGHRIDATTYELVTRTDADVLGDYAFRATRSGTTLSNFDILPGKAASTTAVKVAGQTVWHAGNDGSTSGADSDTVDGVELTSTPTGTRIPKSQADGTLALGWIPATLTGKDADTVDGKNPGSASGLATLDASSLVEQNPANATATPTASKIPIADGSGKLAAGWGGSASTLATLDSNSRLVEAANKISDGTNAIKMKIYNINDWNMDSTANMTQVAHGLTLANIRKVEVFIRDDAGNVSDIITGGGSTGIAGACTTGGVYVNCARTTSGAFDSTSYDATSFNRGWVFITYVE